MDHGGPLLLSNILTTEELEQTPSFLQDKLKKYLDEFFDEFCRQKAAANRLHDYEEKVEDLQSQIQDYEVKIENYEKNVAELRTQLDNVSKERTRLLEQSSSYDKEIATIRLEKNTIADERNAYHNVIERQKCEVDRLRQDISSLELQLTSSIKAKCQAIARFDEIESKEAALGIKEHRIEQERNIMHSQIQTLSADLNRNIAELQTIRRENTLQNIHLETRLTEKIEELKITQEQCHQNKITIDNLNQKVQELCSKNLSQNEEANKMIDHYKKELEAKTKLADLYKASSEDISNQCKEYDLAVSDFKRMLSESTEQYGELETKFKATSLKYEQDLEEKDKIIASKQAEIDHANDLLKVVQEESVEIAISKLAPSAAVATRLMKTDMSLTELYSLYVKTTEELEIQKRENARLKLDVKTILHELGENAPMIKKQELEYEKLVETYNILTQQRDELMSSKLNMEEVMKNEQSKVIRLERENKKLKNSVTDLSRQVCYLLKEVEKLRMGVSTENRPSEIGNMSTTDEVISKKLVTVNSIAELQENNQKLLLLVRDLSSQLEETEKIKKEANELSFREKIESYDKKIQSMQDTLNQQNNTVATLVSKCERYKKMYFELQKRKNNSESMDMSDLDDTEVGESHGENEKEDCAKMSVSSNAERRIRDLEHQLQDVKDQYKTLREQHEYYIKEKQNNEKIQNEQFDSMRTEVRELTSTNCKLMSSVDFTKEQIKIQHKNIHTYKQQIAALEDRNKNYENTIVKHEQTLHFLKDEILKAQCKQATAESEVNQLRNENHVFKDTISRLQSEKESLYREKQSQNLLLNNLELIKTSLERSEMEGRVRLEQRLDDTVRELSAQRRRFQEEEDRFRETVADCKQQAETSKQRMEEERAQSDKLILELTSVKQELASKTNKIDELSQKLQESLTPAKNDNPIVLANKKAKELEVKLEEAKIEITSLTSELDQSRNHIEKYYQMAQSAEKEIKDLHEIYVNFVSNAEKEIKELKNKELNSKSKIAELEAEIQLTSVVENTNTNQPEQLKKTQEELKDVLQKLSDCNRNIRTLRAENTSLAESLNGVERKYANEMVQHSVDIQELTNVKSELTKVQDQIEELKMDRDLAKHSYEELKQSHDQTNRIFVNEKNELESRLTDLNALNSSLHDQIEALASKLSIISQSSVIGNNSANDSVMETSSSTINRSTNIEEDVKNEDQLLQIIKYLRKEKDLTDARLDIVKAENIRLQSENTMLQKKVDELNGFLNQERTKSEAVIVSASKHEEILRKVETISAITDSNRILRDERNSLADRVKELNERISALENELFPLQNQNRELSMKIDELSMETTSLRTEAIKWRQRANVLVEKSNKNPEEFKRLQMERENLAKMLTTEKEVLKQVTDELNGLKAEKLRLQSEHLSLEKQSHTLSEEKKKLVEDFNTLKQTNMRLMQEVMELKNKLLQKEEAVQKLTEDIESKDAQLQDSKNKEFQIRKIAKRYKDSYLELSNKASTVGAEGNSTPGASTTPQENMEIGGNSGPENTTNVEIEQHRSTIENLNGVVRSLQEENEKLRKEFEDLKTSAEIDDRTKTLLREAKTRIVTLTESKNSLYQELTLKKNMLQTAVQSSENLDVEMSGLKIQYEEIVDENNRNKETLARLTRENESLLIRNNQLNRQLGLQQSSKPSTSSVAITDKSGISESSLRTANVKPMSGTGTLQQSATVTPWRGGETPLASIRPISVQNSRTAAILPTSQQMVTGGSSTTTSSSTTSSTSSSTSSSAGCSNTALVPPQQQVQVVESMSSSPTSSHTDYMPSTSSASVAVAAIPPMGSALAAESSQEAESVQQAQQPIESQLLVSGGQQQVVALVSPRVEGSSQNAPSPNIQHSQDPNSQQPSTSGTSNSSCSHITVSNQNRHTPSSSSVTTTQAGSSGGHKRPRDVEGDSSTSAEECGLDKSNKHPKRMRTPLRAGDESVIVGVTDSGFDVEYQVPTSSQRDQEDDIIVVDSEEDDGMAEADGGPADGEMPEPEGYEDSYEQDQDMDMENQCPEIDETDVRADVDVETNDNNEVDIDECNGENQVQCTSAIDNQELVPTYSNDASASTSQAAAVAILAHSQQQEQQQSQAISSGGSYESNTNIPQSGTTTPRKQNTSSLARQQKNALTLVQEGVDTNVTEGIIEQDPSGSDNIGRRSDSSSMQDSKFVYTDASVHSGENENKVADSEAAHERETGADEDFATFVQKKDDDVSSDEGKKTSSSVAVLSNAEEIEEADEDFTEETTATFEGTENIDSHHSSGATQSEIQDMQQGLVEPTSEDNEGIDGVSSEGEKQAVEEVEEEGREAEATTTPSINTRSKATRGSTSARRPSRGFQRGTRPTPIIWQDSPGNSRNNPQNQRGPEQTSGPPRGYPNQRSQRARRMRRPSGGNYSNMRYS